MLKINLSSPVPIYEQLVSEITQNIKNGQLKSGESLPSIRSLANQMDIAANTVARAYQELERNGVIKKFGTKGTFVMEYTKLDEHANNSIFKELILKLLQEGNNKDQIRQKFEHEFKTIFGT